MMEEEIIKTVAEKTEVSTYKWFPSKSVISLPRQQIVDFCQKWKIEVITPLIPKQRD